MRYALVAILLAAPAAAQEAHPATLKAHAVLPAQTFVPPPAEAPPGFNLSGRFTSEDKLREERPYAIVEPDTGLATPFAGQPVQGFSGIRHLGDGRYLTLSDNGYGNRRNSPDALLMLHRVRPDWESGRVALEGTTFLHDPDKKVPFLLVNEFTDGRYLTGGDFDIESVQPVADGYWFGDEFGPYLFKTDADGRITTFVETALNGEAVRSPEHHAVTLPATPDGALDFNLRRSRGYEGMALSPDARTLYPLLEGQVYVDGAPETKGDRPVLRVYEVDASSGAFQGLAGYYPLENADHPIGDFNLIDATRGLVVERDNNQGDPRFDEPAQFKRVYLVDLARQDNAGVIEKLGYVDLLKIDDANGTARRGTIDGTSPFPSSRSRTSIA